MSTIERARHIKRTLGLRRAAVFMRNRGFSVEAAAFVLAREER